MEDWLDDRFNDICTEDDPAFDVVELRRRQLAAHGSTATCAPTGDACAEWNAAIARHEARGLSRREAIREVVHTRPDLHKRFLQSYNNRVR